MEENSKPKMNQDFWELLGGFGEWKKEVSPTADADFEAIAEASIKSYKFEVRSYHTVNNKCIRG